MAGNPEKATLLDLTLTGELSDSVSLEKLKKLLTERFLYVNINVACKNAHNIFLIKDENSLSGWIYQADKKSRACFACEAEKMCDWSSSKKNMKLLMQN